MTRLLVIAAVLALAPALAHAGPVSPTLGVQGTLLTSSNLPATGPHVLTLRLFAAQTGGAPLYELVDVPVTLQSGVFDVELGPLPPTLLADAGSLWLETKVGTDVLPRRPLRPSPWSIAANEAHLARDLACSGCVSGGEVDFPWALAAAKGGAALDLDCVGCVSATELAAGTVATAHLQAGGVTDEKVAFLYAGSVSKGGPAKDLACSGCVAGAEIAANAALVGDVTITGSLGVCTAGGAGCALAIGGPSLANQGGWLTVQASSGLRVRDASGATPRPAEVGGLTSHGGVTVTTGDVVVQSGAVGIGAPPSGAALDVRAAGVAARIQNTTDAATVTAARFASGDRSSPQPGDGGHLAFLSDDAGQKAQERARLSWVQTDPTDGAEDAGLRLHAARGGAITELMRLEYAADQRGAVVINQPGQDVTTRVVAAGEANALVVDGPTGRVGVGVAAPQARLHVAGDVRIDGHQLIGMRLENGSGAPVACDAAHAGYVYFDVAGKAFRGCDGEVWKELGGNGAPATPPTVPGFAGYLGPNLSAEGLTQCYGWRNDGAVAGAVYADIRSKCGNSTTVVFAGYRAGSSALIRHDARLGRPFIDYLPPTFPGLQYFQVFDADSKYSWYLGNPWLLLVKYGNGWSDPGRLWEPHVMGGTAPADGHVLSQDGSNAHDQHLVTGDTYFIYIKQNETYQVVDGFQGYYGPDLSAEGLVQCYGWANDGVTPGALYADIRARCGAGTRVLFAGTRAGSGTLIRHEALLPQPFITFLPATFPTYQGTGSYTAAFDTQNKYSWWLGNPWMLLVKKNNGWSDPGRLWEPNAAGGATAADGHVLSPDGTHAHDQYPLIGDKYYIYVNQ